MNMDPKHLITIDYLRLTISNYNTYSLSKKCVTLDWGHTFELYCTENSFTIHMPIGEQDLAISIII